MSEESVNTNSDTMYSVDFQRQSVKLICTNLKISLSYMDIFRTEYFENQSLRILFPLIKQYIYDYNKEIDETGLNVILEDYSLSHSLSSEMVRTLKSEVKELFKIHIPDEQFVIDKVVKFCRRQEMKSAFMKGIDILQKGDDIEKCRNLVDNALSIGSGTTQSYDFNNIMEIQTEYLNAFNPQNMVKTGYPTLDKALQGGVAAGEVHIVLAPPKCFDGETKVKLLDGRDVAIKEFEKIKEAWVYSYNIETGEIIPAKAIYSNKKISSKNVKVVLDNGEEIICTSDHKFLLSNGQYVEAGKLEKNDSLMSMYYKCKEKGRYQVKPTFGEYKYIHKLVAGYFENIENKEIHHNNEISTDNRPENLSVLTKAEHSAIHAKQRYHKLVDGFNKYKVSERGRKNFDDHKERTIIRNKSEKMKKVSLKNLEKMREANKLRKLDNHKVVEVIKLDDTRTVYDIHVPPKNNFCISSGNIYAGGGKYIPSGIFVHNSGKTTFLTNIAGNALKQGKTVFHASLEIKPTFLMMKYASLITGLSYDDILSLDSETYKYKINSFMKRTNGKLHMNYWTELSATTMDIRSWVCQIRSTVGDSPDLIVLDYDDPLVGETKIPLLDGTEVEIKDLVGRDEFWLYACKEDGTVVPGRGHSARVARTVNEIIEITLDNGEVIKSTLNHNHMMRDGSFKRADEFEPGDSLMPLYRHTSSPSGGDGKRYERVLNNKTGKYSRTHRMVVEYFNPEIIGDSEKHTHHKDGNPLNNDPNNLEVVNVSDHTKEHWKNDENFVKIITDKANEQWSNYEFRELIKKNSTIKGMEVKFRKCKYCGNKFNTTVGGLISHTKICNKKPEIIKEKFICRVCGETKNNTKATFKTHETRCKRKKIGFNIKDEHKETISQLNNHKVVSVKKVKLDEPIPVYCLTVDKYSNYALSAGIFTHNCLLPTKGSSDSMYENSGVVYADMINLADYFGCPIFTASQPQREAWEDTNDDKLITSSKVAHSGRKIHRCTSVTSINGNKDNPNIARLYLDINRRGEGNVVIPVVKDFERSRMREVNNQMQNGNI